MAIGNRDATLAHQLALSERQLSSVSLCEGRVMRNEPSKNRA